MATRHEMPTNQPSLENGGDKENQSKARNVSTRHSNSIDARFKAMQLRQPSHRESTQRSGDPNDEEEEMDARFALSLSQVQVHALQDENERWRTRLKEVKVEKENLEELVTGLQYALTTAETQLADSRDDVDYLNEQVSRLKFLLAQSESECQDLKGGAGFASLFDKCATQRSISCQTTEKDLLLSAEASKEEVVYVTESFELAGSGLSVLDDLAPDARKDLMKHYLDIRNGDGDTESFASSALQLGLIVDEPLPPKSLQRELPSELDIADYESEFDDDASFGDFKTPKSSGRHMAYDDFSSDDDAQLL